MQTQQKASGIHAITSPESAGIPSGKSNQLMILGVFFFSGAAGLAYEVSWTRQLGLLFGQTAQSASLVLGCYFLGMAIGNAAGSRWVRRLHPLTGYALCELIAGLWAILLPLLLKAAAIPAVAALLNHDHHVLQVIVRAMAGGLLLMPATIALGGTLPFMASYLAGTSSSASAATGITLAYALNIAGAFVGVVAATMFGIAALGVAGTSYAASALSILCAGAALLVQRRSPAFPGTAPASTRIPADDNQPAGSVTSGLSLQWVLLAGLSGFGILALQVLYMRMFSLVLHNSVYSFGAVVAVFLVALAAGSAVVSRWGDRFSAEKGLFTACQSGGIAVTGSMLVFVLWTGLEYFQAGTGFYDYLAGILGFASLVMLLPVTILGIILPWIWTAAEQHQSSSAAVGPLTAVNTVAAAAGSVTASFVLLPALGLWGSMVAIALLYVVTPLLVFPGQRTASNWMTSAAAVAFCLMAHAAVARYDGTGDEETLVRRWESAYGWVDVVKFVKTRTLQLRQNIHYGLGSTASVTMERRQAHLPLLIHPDPRDVLFIGLATGITAGGVLDHPKVTSVDVVELIPDVVRAATMFRDFNRDIHNQTRARILVNDGRHFLYASDRQYDVIVADLFVPWESHTGYLYTVENYQAALDRLKPGGIFCQWIPLWQLGERELRLIADSFAQVFPRTTLWYGKIHPHWTILGLVGSRNVINLDGGQLRQRLAVTPAPLAKDRSWFKKPGAVFSMYGGDWQARADGLLNTDENPRVEFYTPVTAWTKGARLRYDGLQEFFESTLARLPMVHVTYQPATGDEDLTPDVLRTYQRLHLSDKD